MKIVSIIGTRPQYIKIKPIYDYCNLLNIDHKIIDTKQHYSDSVSGSLIKDLDLSIDRSFDLSYSGEVDFICKLIQEISEELSKDRPDIVLVYGDTNSTFCASLAAYKLKIPIAHVEAGERCGDSSVPEEINRIFVDNVSTLNFCSSPGAAANIGGIYCGDLEYNLLKSIDPKVKLNDFGVMTIHRQSNCSRDRVDHIMRFCSKVPHNIKFFVHHRIKPLVPAQVPSNVELLDPCIYSDMVSYMASCRFIITDSGSIQKTAPFFGKNTLVMRGKSEWKDTELAGYAKLEESEDHDIRWLTSKPVGRSEDFYLKSGELPANIIIDTIADFVREDEDKQQD